MLNRRHPDEASDTGRSVDDEERIRDDERRRVLAELADTGSDDDNSDDRRPAGDDADWRTSPPPADESPVDPSIATVGPAPAPVDPRRWDLPDDRSPDDERAATDEPRDDEVATRSTARTPTAEVPVTSSSSAVVQEEEVTERGFSPGQILLALAGITSLALGIFALVRTGVETPLDEPVESVLGWDHTAQLALIEIGVGVLLLLSSLRAGARWFGGLVGLAVIAGGILIVGQFDDDVDQWIVDELGAERGFGWLAIGLGAVAVLGALIPRVRRTRRVATTTTA
jgi:hypothetical protein